MRSLFLFGALAILLVFFELFISSCASQSSPSGGPRDTLAPVLDTALPPNMSTNFTQHKVTLIFNEYIQLKSPDQQISFSPPLKNPPTITAKGKEVLINWEKDTLLDSTTYIISFGTAITDYTEGNVNEKIKYVFSTGDFIDSLSLSGSVLDASDGEPTPKIMVALYDYSTLKSVDSIPFKNQPTYYTYTNENGYFSLENLKYSDFHVIAFEDQRGNFKMRTGGEKAAFWGDTLSTTLANAPLKLLAFSPQAPNRYYGVRQTGKGKFQFAFNYHPEKLEINFLDTTLEQGFHFLTFGRSSDTATFWFSEAKQDTLTFIVKDEGEILDTSVAEIREFKAAKFTLSMRNKEVKQGEPITVKTNAPVKMVHDTLIMAFSKTDTLGMQVLPAPRTDPTVVAVKPLKNMDEYKVLFKKGAVENIFGETSDSTLFEILTLKQADLGNLDFTVKADSNYPLVLQFFNPAKEKIVDTAFSGNMTLKLRSMKPGIYAVSLIVDANRDGKWTTGSYLERRQPEVIITYKEKAEIRANWDLELIWEPILSQNHPDNSKESRSDKN